MCFRLFRKSRRINRASEAAEKLNSLKGTGFSPYITSAESTPALAAEGRLSGISPKFHPFSAASLTPAERFKEKIPHIRTSFRSLSGPYPPFPAQISNAIGFAQRGFRVDVRVAVGLGLQGLGHRVTSMGRLVCAQRPDYFHCAPLDNNYLQSWGRPLCGAGSGGSGAGFGVGLMLRVLPRWRRLRIVPDAIGVFCYLSFRHQSCKVVE